MPDRPTDLHAAAAAAVAGGGGMTHGDPNAGIITHISGMLSIASCGVRGLERDE